jgi:hypothetical protein
VESVGISRSVVKSEDGQRILHYWNFHKSDEGGILRELLQERELEDVDILWALRKAMEERDAAAIQICGYLLSLPSDYERKNYLVYILGWPDF